jgi:hypothetical protein
MKTFKKVIAAHGIGLYVGVFVGMFAFFYSLYWAMNAFDNEDTSSLG